MLNFFTDPYKDELLLSAISRYHYYSGNKIPSDTSNEIYAFATDDSPDNYLDGLASKLGGTYTKKELIFEYTLFPIEHFFHKETKYSDSFLLINKNLLFCPDCTKNDIEKYGEAYFHREHQIDGIKICPKHRVELKLYDSKTTWKNRWNYNKFDSKNLDLNSRKVYDSNQYDKLWNISKTFYEILSYRGNKRINEAVLNFYFIKLLHEQGFINRDGIFNKANLEKEIINFYGDTTLDILDEHYKKYKNLRWINKGSSGKQYNPYFCSPFFYNPLQNIIMICFFEKQLNNIIDEIETDYKRFNENPCDNTLWNATFQYYVKRRYRLSEISDEMEISISEVFEYAKKLDVEYDIRIGNLFSSKEEFEIYKKQCLELINLNPSISRSQLSKILKGRYDLIRWYDLDWWEENVPKPLKKKRTSNKNY